MTEECEPPVILGLVGLFLSSIGEFQSFSFE